MSVSNNSSSITTIEDSATDVEVIDLNSNSDTTETTCHDDVSAYNLRNTERSPAGEVDTNIAQTTRSLKTSKSSRADGGVPQPAFKVMFRDENVSGEYRKQIKDFLYDLIQIKPPCKEDTDASSLILEIWDNKSNTKDVDSLRRIQKKVSTNDKHTDDDCNLLFMIDNQPNVNDNLDIPTYGQKYDSMRKKSDSVAPQDFTPKLNCFNCNGNHNMRDCRLPRNQANINKNRKEFIARCNTGVRYHLSEDQRFSYIIPGQMSSHLRQALGLKDNQLPIHIYRMRLLGYPPGWLEEARLQHSGLTLFNSDGMAEADPNDEEGEIIRNEDRDQYDLKKIYDFPGFNVPPPPGTIDDNHKYWAPKMHPMHSKEMMLLQLQGKRAENGYKRKKLKLSMPVANTSGPCSDMEIEDAEDSIVENVPINDHFVPPLPKESVSTPPLPRALRSSGSSGSLTEDSDSQSRDLPSLSSIEDATVNSPSLSELENAKKELLIELEGIGSNSNCTSLKTDLNATAESDAPFSDITSQSDYSPSLQRSLTRDFAKSDVQSSDPTSELNTTLFDTSTTLSPPSFIVTSSPVQSSANTSQCVKSVHMGTPILPSSSPYSKLPSSDKFSKDICDVLNFENLPDATGKYEQMSGVLQKVRSTMAKLHQQT